MIREVYIDGKRIDVTPDDATGYMFTSPIFRDVDKIMSNRTTTYKIPLTANNCKVFGNAHMPNVKFAEEAYRVLPFKEYRDGLLFINGDCRLLKATDTAFELSVQWGNAQKLGKLKDKMLRKLVPKKEDWDKVPPYLGWDDNTAYMPQASPDNFGFPVLDIGTGVDDASHVHPSVNVLYMLDLIKSSEGIEIKYTEEFKDVFKTTWIPLLEKNADEYTWATSGKYKAISTILYFATPEEFNGKWKATDYSRAKFSENGDLIQSEDLFSKIKARKDSSVGITSGVLKLKTVRWFEDLEYEMKIFIGQKGYGGETYVERIVDLTNVGGELWATFDFKDKPLSYQSDKDEDVYVKMLFKEKDLSKWHHLDNYFGIVLSSSIQDDLVVFAKPTLVEFGDLFPIPCNLPDISVIDFLKTLMNMFGLFTHYNANDGEEVIQLVSVKEIYTDKPKAYDWTNKLVATTKGNMSVEYHYGKYCQKNFLRYKDEKEVKNMADGYIEIVNKGLKEEQDLYKLPFAPSDNIAGIAKGEGEEVGGFSNSYAKIHLHDSKEEAPKKTSPRILTENVYIQPNTGIRFKSCVFDDSLKFGHKKNGLITKYYPAYQKVLEHPVVIECYVYMDVVELHKYRENIPVFIQGVYYMPISITVQEGGLAVCKMIKMPYMEE